MNKKNTKTVIKHPDVLKHVSAHIRLATGLPLWYLQEMVQQSRAFTTCYSSLAKAHTAYENSANDSVDEYAAIRSIISHCKSFDKLLDFYSCDSVSNKALHLETFISSVTKKISAEKVNRRDANKLFMKAYSLIKQVTHAPESGYICPDKGKYWSMTDDATKKAMRWCWRNIHFKNVLQKFFSEWLKTAKYGDSGESLEYLSIIMDRTSPYDPCHIQARKDSIEICIRIIQKIDKLYILFTYAEMIEKYQSEEIYEAIMQQAARIYRNEGVKSKGLSDDNSPINYLKRFFEIVSPSDSKNLSLLITEAVQGEYY